MSSFTLQRANLTLSLLALTATKQTEKKWEINFNARIAVDYRCTDSREYFIKFLSLGACWWFFATQTICGIYTCTKANVAGMCVCKLHETLSSAQRNDSDAQVTDFLFLFQEGKKWSLSPSHIMIHSPPFNSSLSPTVPFSSTNLVCDDNRVVGISVRRWKHFLVENSR